MVYGQVNIYVTVEVSCDNSHNGGSNGQTIFVEIDPSCDVPLETKDLHPESQYYTSSDMIGRRPHHAALYSSPSWCAAMSSTNHYIQVHTIFSTAICYSVIGFYHLNIGALKT